MAAPLSNGAVATTASPEPHQQPEVSTSPSSETTISASEKPPEPADPVKDVGKWPGWPGDCVFRLVVPVLKVGSIIGRKGEFIKKMCEETRARIRILDGAIGTPNRVVLISGKEEPDAEISPAMDAVLRVFKRVNGASDDDGDGTVTASTGMCSVRLLVAQGQAVTLIGKQGSVIKSIQERSGATIRVLNGDELPLYVKSDERIVEIQGEFSQVLNALQASIGHLRKFLVDRSVIPLFEKTYVPTTSQDQATDAWADEQQPSIHASAQSGVTSDYPRSLKRDSLYIDHEARLEPQILHSGLSLYGQDSAVAGLRSSGLGRSAAALVTQVTQTMQIPLSYAEDIIGVGGANIAYMRHTSGAILTVQESRGLPDEITVEIKGTSMQVQTAQLLIEEFMAGRKESLTSTYSKLDMGLRSHSLLSNTSYSSSSYGSQSLGGYGSGLGGYGSYRL